MITRKDVMPINYYKKEAFTGSFCGMRYKLSKAYDEDGERLEAIIWPQPFCFEKTDEKEKQYAYFSFDEEGILQAIDWMNKSYEKRKEEFMQAQQKNGL